MKSRPAIAVIFTVLASFAFAQTTPVAQVTKDKLGQTVTVSGTIGTFTPSRSERAPNSFMLRDASGEIRVVVWQDVFSVLPGKDQVKPGAAVTVAAEVAEYREKIELHMKSPTGIQIGGAAGPAPVAAGTPAAITAPAPQSFGTPVSVPIGAAPAATPAPVAVTGATATTAGTAVAVSSLSANNVDQTVTVRGTVTSFRAAWSATAPNIMKVSDGTGSLDVVYWSDVAEQMGDKKPAAGDAIEATGKLGKFREALQLRIASPQDMKLQKGAASAVAPPQQGASANDARRIRAAELERVPLKTLVHLKGQVTKVEPLRGGNRVSLKDESGSALLLFWDQAEGLKPESRFLKAGDEFELVGSVEDLEGSRVVTITRPEYVLSVGQSG